MYIATKIIHHNKQKYNKGDILPDLPKKVMGHLIRQRACEKVGNTPTAPPVESENEQKLRKEIEALKDELAKAKQTDGDNEKAGG